MFPEALGVEASSGSLEIFQIMSLGLFMSQ